MASAMAVSPVHVGRCIQGKTTTLRSPLRTGSPFLCTRRRWLCHKLSQTSILRAGLLRVQASQENGSSTNSLKSSDSLEPEAPTSYQSTGSPLSSSSRRPQADSTDWIASALTRRFGIGAGLAWVGFLAFGVISEQIKTRTEVYLEEKDTRDVENASEITTPQGIIYSDLRIGGGSSPYRGDLVLVGLTGKVANSSSFFIDTSEPGKRDVVFAFDRKPYVRGICEGLEIAMEGMKAGGKRRIIVPPELGFGTDGADFGDGITVPGNASLEYVVELKRVSIAPS